MMALFGILMVIVGQTVKLEGEGTAMLVVLSDRLGEELGPAGKWLFLVGTFGTVFSSLLGVWQATPYLFAECWRLGVRRDAKPVDTRAPTYRWFLLVLAVVPMLGLFGELPRRAEDLYVHRRVYFSDAGARADRVQLASALGRAAVQESSRDDRRARRGARILHLARCREHPSLI